MLDRLPHAGVGAAVWVLTALATATGAIDLTLVDILLLLAPLVLVPVGLAVAARTEAAGPSGCAWPPLCWSSPPCWRKRVAGGPGAPGTLNAFGFSLAGLLDGRPATPLRPRT
ncbi:MAG: hypothetical protein ACR2KK_12325 [Acidimicrobiales bacterium]